MIFNVSGLLKDPVGSTRHYEPEPPVHRGSVTLTRLPGSVLVQFTGEVVLEAECSRCLTPFGYPEHVEFEEIFVQQVDVATGHKLPPPEEADDEDAFKIGLDHSIDISEAVRQYSEMAAAMQPLCRPDCPGLCVQCGQDLTVGACACDREPTDSRWAALADLKRFPNG